MNRHKGFTLLELLIVIAIIGILSSIAVPALGSMVQRNNLKAALQSFQDDMQLARTLAIKRNQSIIISRTAGDLGNWCYGFTEKKPSTKTACNCMQTDIAATDYCDVKQVLGGGFSSTNLADSLTHNNTIDFRRGTISANGLTFSTTDYAARVVFSDVGRVRICIPVVIPTGAVGLPDVPDC